MKQKNYHEAQQELVDTKKFCDRYYKGNEKNACYSGASHVHGKIMRFVK